MKLSKIICCMSACASLFIGVARANAEIPSFPKIPDIYNWISYPTYIQETTKNATIGDAEIERAKAMIDVVLPLKPELRYKVNKVVRRYSDDVYDIKVYFDGDAPIYYSKIEMVRQPSKTFLLISIFAVDVR